MPYTIDGLGLAIPLRSLSQESAADHAVEMWGDAIGRANAIRGLFRRSGVEQRHSVLIDPDDDQAAVRQSFYLPSRNSSDGGPSTRIRMDRFEQEALPLGLRSCQAALENAEVA